MARCNLRRLSCLPNQQSCLALLLLSSKPTNVYFRRNASTARIAVTRQFYHSAAEAAYEYLIIVKSTVDFAPRKASEKGGVCGDNAVVPVPTDTYPSITSKRFSRWADVARGDLPCYHTRSSCTPGRLPEYCTAVVCHLHSAFFTICFVCVFSPIAPNPASFLFLLPPCPHKSPKGFSVMANAPGGFELHKAMQQVN